MFARNQPDVEEVVKEWFSSDQNRVITANTGGGKTLIRLIATVWNLWQQRAAIVNFHFNLVEGTSLLAICAARLAGKRVVITYQHLDAECVLPRQHYEAIRLALKMTSDVIVSTPLLSERVKRILPSSRVHVIPLGVDPVHQDYDRQILRRKYGLPDDAFVVGHISRLITGKGLPRVAEAICKLKDRYENLWLIACGTPDRDAEQLRSLLAQKLPGRSQMLEFVEDQNEMLACCNVLAVPSGWEGFGLVYIEAAMHGLPRIGTRMGGVPYVVRDGVDGLLVELDDIDGLASAIARLHDDAVLCRRFGEEAKRYATLEFTAHRMAERYAEILSPNRRHP